MCGWRLFENKSTKNPTRPKIQGGSAHCETRRCVGMDWFYWLLQQNSAKGETRGNCLLQIFNLQEKIAISTNSQRSPRTQAQTLPVPQALWDLPNGQNIGWTEQGVKFWLKELYILWYPPKLLSQMTVLPYKCIALIIKALILSPRIFRTLLHHLYRTKTGYFESTESAGHWFSICIAFYGSVTRLICSVRDFNGTIFISIINSYEFIIIP